jgi:hypothetical protein
MHHHVNQDEFLTNMIRRNNLHTKCKNFHQEVRYFAKLQKDTIMRSICYHNSQRQTLNTVFFGTIIFILMALTK